MAAWGQAIIFCWVNLLLLRVIGVVKGLSALLCGVALVLLTIGLFVFASSAVYKECSKVDSSASAAMDEESADSMRDTADIASSEWRRGGTSPQDSEIELTVSTSDEHEVAASKTASPWGLFGLCTAVSEDAQHSSDDIAALQAKLTAQAELVESNATRMRENRETHENALRQKDKAHEEALREKDAEIERLLAAAAVAT